LVVGSLIATAPALAAATIPPPNLSALIPPSAQVTSVISVRLTPTGPNQEIVKTVVSCPLGDTACSKTPFFYDGIGYPLPDLFVLAWDHSTRHWVIVFDTDKSTLFSTLVPKFGYGFISEIKTSTITPTEGITDLVVSAYLSPGANTLLNVGIVHYDGKTASLAYRGSFLDGDSARVTGTRPHQLLQLTIPWITESDCVACAVRSYTQMIGWGSPAHGLPGGYYVVSDTRSWLGLSVSVELSNTSTPNNPTVLSVVPGSPAAGLLQPGDTLLGVEGIPPRPNLIGPPVIDQIASQQPGTRIALSIERGGSEKIVNLTLSSYASSAYEAYAEDSLGLSNLGMEVADLTPPLRHKDGIVAKSGAVIVGVVPGSPADNAGMTVGDVIVSVGSHRITDTQDLSEDASLAYGTSWQIAFKNPNNQRHVADVATGSYQAWFYPPGVTAL